MSYIEPKQRECPACRFSRIPYAEIVKKNKKCWIIYTCPICKLRDIDTYTPRRVFDAFTKKFQDETIPDAGGDE